jgi:hypothetical protein
MRLLPRREPVVEHDPRAAERLPEGVPVPGPRVKTVVVPEQHKPIILGCVARYGDIRTGGNRVFAMVFATNSGNPSSPRDTWSGCRRSCGTADQLSELRCYYWQARRRWSSPYLAGSQGGVSISLAGGSGPFRCTAQIRPNMSSHSRRTRTTTGTGAGRSSTSRRSEAHSPARSTPAQPSAPRSRPQPNAIPSRPA